MGFKHCKEAVIIRRCMGTSITAKYKKMVFFDFYYKKPTSSLFLSLSLALLTHTSLRGSMSLAESLLQNR